MATFRISTRCECQARLFADLDDHRFVLSGWAAKGSREDERETAPAHSMAAAGDRFDLGWLCPYCGRNTLRTFEKSALRRVA